MKKDYSKSELWALLIEFRYSDSYRTKKNYRTIGLTELSD